VDEDALIAKAETEGKLARARGEEARARAELHAAQASFEAAIEITAQLAKAQADLEGRSAAAEQRSQALVKGRAQVSIAQDELLVQRELEAAGVAGPRQVELAAARVDEARGELALLEADAALAQAEARGAQAELARVSREADLRIEERRRVADAEAALAVAQGAVAETKAACDAACLRLERMVVRAPVNGVVLERRATVGTPLIGMDHVVATLYDPTSVRLRVDVPQQDLSKLFVGQRARIESDARSGRPYEGLVQRIVQRADLQKVTLQVHVRVLDADDLLRPEMLMQVRFLAPQADAATTDTTGTAGGVAIPSRLVQEGGRVWVLDPVQGTAVLRSVKTGSRDGDLVVVSEGLDLSDKLIDSGGAVLREGMHVREVQP
jgi:HlyD family secretion protein